MTRDISCKEFKSGLLTSFDGEVIPGNVLLFERHCAECSACRALKHAFLTERAVLKGAEPPYVKAGPHFTSMVLKHIKKENAPAPGGYAFPVLTFASAFAALMIFGVPDGGNRVKPGASSLNPFYSADLSQPGSVDSSALLTFTENTSDLFYKLSCRKLDQLIYGVDSLEGI